MEKSLPVNIPSPLNTEESEVFGEQSYEFNESIKHNNINDDGNISGVSENITCTIQSKSNGTS